MKWGTEEPIQPGESACSSSGLSTCDDRAMLRFFLLTATVITALSITASKPNTDAPAVSVLRVPEAGLQPQIEVPDRIVHLLYFSGDAAGGDLSYVRSRDYGRTFSRPLRVNSQPGSAMATGNIRGGREDRVGSEGTGPCSLDRIAKHAAPRRFGFRAGTVRASQRPWHGVRTGALRQPFVVGSRWRDGCGGGYLEQRLCFLARPATGRKGRKRPQLWMAKSMDGGRDLWRPRRRYLVKAQGFVAAADRAPWRVQKDPYMYWFAPQPRSCIAISGCWLPRIAVRPFTDRIYQTGRSAHA